MDNKDVFDGLSQPNKKGSRGRKSCFSDSQLFELNKKLSQSAYLKATEREELARKIGLSAKQVQLWFQNRRNFQKRKQRSVLDQVAPDNRHQIPSPVNNPTIDSLPQDPSLDPSRTNTPSIIEHGSGRFIAQSSSSWFSPSQPYTSLNARHAMQNSNHGDNPHEPSTSTRSSHPQENLPYSPIPKSPKITYSILGDKNASQTSDTSANTPKSGSPMKDFDFIPADDFFALLYANGGKFSG